jgi:hypothetical protein
MAIAFVLRMKVERRIFKPLSVRAIAVCAVGILSFCVTSQALANEPKVAPPTGKFYPLAQARMHAFPAQRPLQFYATPERPAMSAPPVAKTQNKSSSDSEMSHLQAQQLLEVFAEQGR